jgi:hypothetical protein
MDPPVGDGAAERENDRKEQGGCGTGLFFAEQQIHAEIHDKKRKNEKETVSRRKRQQPQDNEVRQVKRARLAFGKQGKPALQLVRPERQGISLERFPQKVFEGEVEMDCVAAVNVRG